MKDTNTKQQFIKDCLFGALMILMKNKDYQGITITELAQKAGVSRMAFYRNFNSIDNIIIDYLERNPFGFSESFTEKEFDLQKQLKATIKYFVSNKVLMQNLIKANKLHMFMDLLDKYFRGKYAAIPSQLGFTGYYGTSAFIGICYKIIVDWAVGGMREDIDSMVNHSFTVLSTYRDVMAVSTSSSYSEKTIGHFARPQNLGRPSAWNAMAEFGLALTGDSIRIYLLVANERIVRIGAEVEGIPTVSACASAATQLIKGKPLSEARTITKEKITAELGGLPSDKLYCAGLAEGAIKAAALNYYNRQSLGIAEKTES